MTPRQYNTIQHWLEYCKPATWRWWTEGGYFQRKDGSLK